MDKKTAEFFRRQGITKDFSTDETIDLFLLIKFRPSFTAMAVGFI